MSAQNKQVGGCRSYANPFLARARLRAPDICIQEGNIKALLVTGIDRYLYTSIVANVCLSSFVFGMNFL